MEYGTKSGPVEVAMNGIWIPAELIQTVTPDIEPKTITVPSLGGSYEKPSGTYETTMLTFVLNLPSMDYLKNIVPNLYNAPTPPQTTGNVFIGSQQCLQAEGVPVVVHYVCDETDADDLTFPNGFVTFAFNGEYNEDDPLTVEVRVYGTPDVHGNRVRFGTGDLAQPSRWDAATEQTVPVTSS